MVPDDSYILLLAVFIPPQSDSVWDITIAWARVLVQVTINRGLRIGRDGHLDQFEAYDIQYIVACTRIWALNLLICWFIVGRSH